MNRPRRLILVDDDHDVQAVLRKVLKPTAWELSVLTECSEARRCVREESFDVIIANLRFHGDCAIGLLQDAARLHPDSTRIALAGPNDIALAEQAINRGEVFRFFLKPWRREDVRAMVEQVRERLDLRDEVARLLELTRNQNEQLRAWNEKLEARVAERTQALRTSQAQLAQSEKMAAIGQLAGGVAHEINNPLASILVFARTAARDLSPEHPARHDLEEIEHAARRGKKIVESLLMFSRRSRPEERTSIDLPTLIKSSEPLFKAASRSRVIVDTEDVPPITGNAHRLQQVLLNLVGNADQAMDGRGTVTVKVRPEGDWVLLQVSDEGPGISEGARAHIFEPFYTTKPQGKGTGLGLAIVYGIVREHQGEIAVENQVPSGACFQVRFPARLQEVA